MNSSQGLLLAIGWFLLRFGIPFILTIVVCWFFKRIDARWKAEAEAYRKKIEATRGMSVVRCWLFNNCSEDKHEKCPAYLNQATPCWQQFRASTGQLQERCLGCGIFRGVPTIAAND